MAAPDSGPTLNERFNDLLRKAIRLGWNCKPECDCCGADLTGKNVYDTICGWAGDCCAGPDDEGYEFDEERDRPFDPEIDS